MARTIWEYGLWSLGVTEEGNFAGHLVVIDKERGLSDHPVCYRDGTVAFDFPERIPWYVQEAVKVAYQPYGTLRELRFQLAKLAGLLEDWGWSDKQFDVPCGIAIWAPGKWWDTNWSIMTVWDQFTGNYRKEEEKFKELCKFGDEELDRLLIASEQAEYV